MVAARGCYAVVVEEFEAVDVDLLGEVRLGNDCCLLLPIP